MAVNILIWGLVTNLGKVRLHFVTWQRWHKLSVLWPAKDAKGGFFSFPLTAVAANKLKLSQSLHNMGPLMDLNGYLSMAWSLLPCHTTGCFSLCFFGASFFLSSLDGKREFTATGALSTSTTVRLLTASSARAIQSADQQVCVCCRCLTSGGLMSVCVLFVCVQTRRTRSGRTLACRVQLSQDPWVVSAARSSGSHAPGGLSAASSSVPVRHGRTALSPPLNMPTPLCCCMYGRTTSDVADPQPQLLLWGHTPLLCIQPFFSLLFRPCRPFPTPGSSSRNTTTSGRS